MTAGLQQACHSWLAQRKRGLGRWPRLDVEETSLLLLISCNQPAVHYHCLSRVNEYL